MLQHSIQHFGNLQENETFKITEVNIHFSMRGKNVQLPKNIYVAFIIIFIFLNFSKVLLYSVLSELQHAELTVTPQHAHGPLFGVKL